jgi:phosphoglycerol geranylgeranyltransferase
VRYLSTIPSVDDPVRLAREYSGTTVRAWLELQKRREQATESEEDSRSTVSVRRTVLRAAIAPVVDGDIDQLAATIARAALAGRHDDENGEHGAAQLSVSGMEE